MQPRQWGMAGAARGAGRSRREWSPLNSLCESCLAGTDLHPRSAPPELHPQICTPKSAPPELHPRSSPPNLHPQISTPKSASPELSLPSAWSGAAAADEGVKGWPEELQRNFNQQKDAAVELQHLSSSLFLTDEALQNPCKTTG